MVCGCMVPFKQPFISYMINLLGEAQMCSTFLKNSTAPVLTSWAFPCPLLNRSLELRLCSLDATPLDFLRYICLKDDV